MERALHVDPVTLCFVTAIPILLLFFVFRLSAVEQQLNSLAAINHKLDALIQHAGIEYDPFENVSDEVIGALQRGNKIEAIRHYRQATGAGLKEAKEQVEEIQRRAGL